MINWSKYFDKIYCLHFIPYTERKKLMDFQLKRVGILDSGIFEYSFTYGNQQEKKFKQYVKKIRPQIENDKFISIPILYGHYKIIKKAKEQNLQHILILEDDARFLKDLDKIEQILSNRPKNANVILYDKFIIKSELNKQFKPINNYYNTFECCCSTGCYSLDNIGIKYLLHKYETYPQTADGYFYAAKDCLKGLTYCCSNKNLAVQASFKKSNNVNLMQNTQLTFQMFYKYLNIDFNDYMMRKDGSPYNYGDYIEE